jgi:hypothetical protein
MRKDMSKVLVERRRLGSKRAQRKGRTQQLLDADDAPLRARDRSLKRDKPDRTKSLNENLSPLRRYLESNIGRSWNKVHSEIAKNLRLSNAVQKHVLDHVEDFVATKTSMRRGEVHVVHSRFGGEPAPLSDAWTLLYVHPKTGRLMRNRQYRQPPKSRRKKPPPPEKRRRELGALRQAHLFRDGAWWDVVLEANPVRRETVRDSANRVTVRKTPLPFQDVVAARGLSDLAPDILYGRANVHAVSARRLTKAERKKLDLP